MVPKCFFQGFSPSQFLGTFAFSPPVLKFKVVERERGRERENERYRERERVFVYVFLADLSKVKVRMEVYVHSWHNRPMDPEHWGLLDARK